MINILAVENNRKISTQIYAALSDKSRYHLAVVESGYTALEAIGQKRFHLIIIGRDLAYMSGLKTAQKIRSILGDETPPFVICAAQFSREEIEDFLPTGIFDVLESP
ncbi:MAG: response regulator, partial [[Eubacterium] siraeum]|nr:response regulator [[Eubacterium] siraeum]